MAKSKVATEETTAVAGSARKEESGLPDDVRERLRYTVGCFESQMSAAAAAGIAKSSLQRHLSGQSSPDFETVARLAEAANVGLDWIWAGVDRSNPAAVEQHGDLDEECLRDVVAAVEIEMGRRNKELSPERKALLIKEIYTHARAERLSGTRDEQARRALAMFIRRMVNVAS